MAAIPGWAYAGVGFAIMIYSKFVKARSPENTIMGLFFWVGLLLLGIGVFKLALLYLLGGKKKDKKKERDQESRPVPRDAIYCPRCNAKLHPQSRYCNWCGTQQ
jgi:hypothetical protein